MQNTLTSVVTIKSPEDYDAISQLLSNFASNINNALDTIKTVHFARIVFLDNNTKLALITEFDGDFVTYVQDFANSLGQVFDALFAHIADAPPLPVEDPQNTQAFIEFMQKNNVAPSFFYSAYPDLTVVNILDLQKGEQG